MYGTVSVQFDSESENKLIVLEEKKQHFHDSLGEVM